MKSQGIRLRPLHIQFIVPCISPLCRHVQELDGDSLSSDDDLELPRVKVRQQASPSDDFEPQASPTVFTIEDSDPEMDAEEAILRHVLTESLQDATER